MIFKKLFLTRVRGKVVSYFPDRKKDVSYHGFYFLLEELSPFESDSDGSFLFLHDGKTYIKIKDLLDRGIPVLISHDNRPMGAALVPRGNSLMLYLKNRGFVAKSYDRPFFMITPEANFDTLIHEKVHFDDEINGFVEGLKKKLKSLGKKFKPDSSINESDLISIYFFLLEQRAYSRQLHECKRVSESSGVIFVIDILTDKVVTKPSKEYLNDLIEHEVGFMNKLYVHGVIEALNKIKAESRILYFEFKKLIEQSVFESEEMSLAKLLGEHFE